jgi:phosphatidylglycerol:prolipoprotein diacylglycerol transferase
MGALGFAAASFVGLRFARARGVAVDAVIDVVFWSSLAALLGARGLYLLQTPGSWQGIGSLLLPRGGGMVFYGGPLVGLPVAAWWVWRARLPVGVVLDMFGLAAPLAHALARLGCLAAGCCWGAPTGLPWGVTYTDPLAPGPHGVALHPVQAYEAAGLAVIAAWAAWRAPRRAFEGELFVGWVGAYAVLRLATETLRDDASRGFWGPLSTSQWISVGALAALAVAAVVARVSRRPAPPPGPPDR